MRKKLFIGGIILCLFFGYKYYNFYYYNDVVEKIQKNNALGLWLSDALLSYSRYYPDNADKESVLKFILNDSSFIESKDVLLILNNHRIKTTYNDNKDTLILYFEQKKGGKGHYLYERNINFIEFIFIHDNIVIGGVPKWKDEQEKRIM